MRLIKKNLSTNSSGEDKNDWKKEVVSILNSKAGRIFFGVLVGLVVLRLGSNWLFRSKRASDVPYVTISLPEVQKMDQTLNLPANIEALEQASLYAHVGGYLKKIYVDEGDHVKKGQLLAEIDAPDIVQEFHKAKAEYDLKDVTAKRYQELLKEKVISQQEFDNIDADANESKARFDNAAANVAFTRITAPFTGSIARRFKYPGDLISTNTRSGTDQPLFILVNEQTLRAAINVPQIEVGNIHTGDPVDIRVDAFPDRKFQGSITRLDALLDDATKTQRVLIDIDNADGSLHAGMFASAILHIKEVNDAVTVPKDSVRDEDAKHYLFIEKDLKAYKKEVQLGMELNGKVQILQGIAPTDHVIRLGAAILKDGSPVILAK
jgi:RND family efflux transporter MFP subunit